MILSSRIKVEYILLLILFILVIVSINGFMGEDEGRFSYMGRIWANDGLPPYSESIENKTPGIFILNAISFMLFGTNYFFLRLLGITVSVISAFYIFQISKILFNRDAGIISSLVFGLTLSWRDMDGAFASYTETYMIFFVILSFFIIINTSLVKNEYLRIFISGLLMAFAIAFKQIALTSAFALIIFILFLSTKKIKKSNYILDVLFYICGVILGSFISIVPLLISNVSIYEYIDGAWLLLLDDGSTPDFSKRFLFARELWIESRLVFFYPFFLLYIFQSRLLNKKILVLLAVWFICDYIGANASGYYFGHQIRQIVPSLSILVGISLVNLLQIVSAKKAIRERYFKRMVLIIIFMMLPYELLSENILRLHSGKYHDPNKDIGLYIKDRTESKDFVFMMTNANAIQSYTDRVSASKYFNPLFMNEESEYDLVLNDLILKKPKYIVMRENERQFKFPLTFYDFVNNNYILSDTISGFHLFLINNHENHSE